MRIVIGCPVRDRAWCLSAWFEYVEKAVSKALETFPDLELVYAFVVGPSQDDTQEVLRRCLVGTKSSVVFDPGERPVDMSYRSWNEDRYADLTLARNRLLGLVREIQPDFFLSLDSDILIHENTLINLLDTIIGFDVAAVGGKCYLTPKVGGLDDGRDGRYAPSYATISGSSMQRQDASGVFEVDIIMAIKLMSRYAYNIDYEVSHQGEDFGWSRAVKRSGERLYWDGRQANKHLMQRTDIDEVDERVGY